MGSETSVIAISSPAQRDLDYQELFRKSTLEFERRLDELSHVMCIICQSVTMRKEHQSRRHSAQYICEQCIGTVASPESLPVWFDKNNMVQYHVPHELAGLREGEKLLIQQVSVYVPLQHLMYGQVGARGHIVSFPQNVMSVCKTLPRLPEHVQVVRVIKNFRLSDGTVSNKTFIIRRAVVMSALIWLKKFNIQYRDIDICEANLSWITNGNEQELPIQAWEEPEDPTPENHNVDLGPSPQQIAEQLENQDEPLEPTYGICTEFNANKPKPKDKGIVDVLVAAEMRGKMLAIDRDGSAIHFPYVSPDPVCEYSELYLMEYAFPWLFPGGTGGYMSGRNPKPRLKDWLKRITLYKDGRFDHDRLWAFFALNYYTRHQNQSSGSFYVKTFYENGPKTLEQIQKQVSEGHLEWLDRITYFSQCVTGSSAYWRARRREVFAWISYHMEKGNGVPTFFITLSCAEYHWTDIERLIIDKCRVAGIDLPDFSKGT